MSLQLNPGKYLGEQQYQVLLKDHIITLSDYSCNISLPLHYHQNMVIGYVTRGTYFEKISKKLLTYTEHSLIVQPAQIEHQNCFSVSSAQCVNIEFTPQKIEQLKSSNISFANLVTLKSSYISNNIDKIMSELSAMDSLSDIVIDSIINEILVYTQRNTNSAFEKRVPFKIKKIKEHLDENYMITPVLQQLSVLTGLSSFYLSREFRRCYGCNIGEYIRQVRIKTAVAKLRQKKKSITEIAYECGFADASHFIRIFKKAMGITPAQYLRNI